MSWAFARCSCGDVIERYGDYWQHLAQAGPRCMIRTKLGDLEHQALYELVEKKLYLRPTDDSKVPH